MTAAGGSVTSTATSRVLSLDVDDRTRILNYGIKAALVAAFAVALIIPPDTLDGKGMIYRAPVFLGPAIVVPLLARSRGWKPYPHTADALLSAPFLVDTLANLFGFYDNFGPTDDVLHTVNWVLLVAAFHAFRFRNVFERRDAWFLGAGFGALAIVAWEIGEWIVSEDGILGEDGLALTYSDTVGDLTLSTAGGLIGSWLGIRYLGPVLDRRR